jgi:hypothetical protein
LRKLYIFEEDVMTGVDLGGGMAPAPARDTAIGSQGGWRRMVEADARLAVVDARVKPTRPPRRLLFCALAEFVEPEGVDSDRKLERDGHVAANIGSAAAHVCVWLNACTKRDGMRRPRFL